MSHVPHASPSVTNLSAYLPFLISGNVRLKHRYPAAPQVDVWIRNAFIRRSIGAPPCVGAAGELVLGELHPVPGKETAILDHTGVMHVLPASTHPRPVRVLATLGNRDSAVHVNGGLFDPATGAAVSSIAISAGSTLAWLGEPSGIVGHLLADAPKRVLSVEDDATAAAAGGGGKSHTTVQLVPHACTFVVIGLVYDASSGQPLHIRSLSPLPPPTPPARVFPKLILVGSTSSTTGKTALACSVILSLHAQRHVQDKPRLTFLKLTGSGSLKDTFDVLALKTSDGQPAVARAYDHVDVGLISTYATTAERFKTGVIELLALAAAPMNGAPVEYVICELGSDLIWAHNPLLLSMSQINHHLLGLFVLTTDALSILGCCNFLHQNLKLPPSKLILINSHLSNYAGMIQRIKGSEVNLFQHSIQQVSIALEILNKKWEQEEEERAAVIVQEQENRRKLAVQEAQAELAQQQQQHHGSVNGSNSSQTHPGSSSTSSSHPSTPAAVLSSSRNNTSDPRFEMNIPALEFPSTLTCIPPAQETCDILMRWVLGDTLKTSVEFEYDASDLSVLISTVTKDPSLQDALNFQFLLRKRDRLRAKRKKDELDAAAAVAAGKDAPSLQPLNPAGAHLLQLGDYSNSPYCYPAYPIPPPDSLPGLLLESEPPLAWLRQKMVPQRVSEEAFWQTYFEALRQRVGEYVTKRKSRGGNGAGVLMM